VTYVRWRGGRSNSALEWRFSDRGLALTTVLLAKTHGTGSFKSPPRSAATAAPAKGSERELRHRGSWPLLGAHDGHPTSHVRS
jgi:hypothetical protein